MTITFSCIGTYVQAACVSYSDNYVTEKKGKSISVEKREGPEAASIVGMLSLHVEFGKNNLLMCLYYSLSVLVNPIHVHIVLL